MVIGLQIGKLHRGSGPPAVLDSKKPGLLRVKVLNTIDEAAIAIGIKDLNGQQTTKLHEIMENLKLVSSEILEKMRN